MRVCMLTTVDNPFDPFENFTEWYKIDMQFQYNTCALVARLVPDSENLPQPYMEQIKEEILTNWCRMNPLTYKLLVREVEEPEYDDEGNEIEDESNSDDDKQPENME